MQIVPKNKRVYIKGRKYIEGEALPPFVYLDCIEEMKPVATVKPKRKYRKRKKS